jgi:hypothetical protein
MFHFLKTERSGWSAVGLSLLLLANSGCIRLAHHLHHHSPLKLAHHAHEPYYHCPDCGQVVPKHLHHHCAGHVVPPFFGHQATCWHPWPAEWIGCPTTIIEEIESVDSIHGSVLIQPHVSPGQGDIMAPLPPQTPEPPQTPRPPRASRSYYPEQSDQTAQHPASPIRSPEPLAERLDLGIAVHNQRPASWPTVVQLDESQPHMLISDRMFSAAPSRDGSHEPRSAPQSVQPPAELSPESVQPELTQLESVQAESVPVESVPVESPQPELAVSEGDKPTQHGDSGVAQIEPATSETVPEPSPITWPAMDIQEAERTPIQVERLEIREVNSSKIPRLILESASAIRTPNDAPPRRGESASGISKAIRCPPLQSPTTEQTSAAPPAADDQASADSINAPQMLEVEATHAAAVRIQLVDRPASRANVAVRHQQNSSSSQQPGSSVMMTPGMPSNLKSIQPSKSGQRRYAPARVQFVNDPAQPAQDQHVKKAGHRWLSDTVRSALPF